MYELDTARAKTPAERLRIVAEAWEAMRRGEGVCTVHTETGKPYRWISEAELLEYASDEGVRLATKRRPVIVIPALELFEAPMTEAPEFREHYYTPTISVDAPHPGCYYGPWRGDSIDLARLASGLVFRTQEAAARIGLHIRNELAKAVAK
jgi:hypothetical protein